MVDITPAATGVTINSGTRCSTWNKAVGGRPGSKHLRRPEHDDYSLAGDLTLIGVPLIVTLEAAFEIPAFVEGGIGLYPDEDFVHVDCRRGRKRWGRVGGVIVTLEEALHHLRSKS